MDGAGPSGILGVEEAVPLGEACLSGISGFARLPADRDRNKVGIAGWHRLLPSAR